MTNDTILLQPEWGNEEHRPVRSIVGSDGIALHFPNGALAEAYEQEEQALAIRTYWNIRETYGIWASNQGKYVEHYGLLSPMDNRLMELRCMVVYGPRHFRLSAWLDQVMRYGSRGRRGLRRWKLQPKVNEFLALTEQQVVLWADCGPRTWLEIERTQRLYKETYGDHQAALQEEKGWQADGQAARAGSPVGGNAGSPWATPREGEEGGGVPARRKGKG